MFIKQVTECEEKKSITRFILEALPDWFAAKECAVKNGYEFMQVKTVKMGIYEDYDATNLFYKSLGFKELEVFPTLWDEANPCQIYIMGLNK